MKHVLLVEDDPFLIDIYGTKLRESGFNVEVAQDGEQAVRKAEDQKFDLVILDIVLPKLDGWGVLEKIQNKDGKIIVLSNLGQKEEVEKGLKLGAVKYLIKAHYTPSQIIEEIKEIID